MKFVVVGLGYFGSALVRELIDCGHEVLAIDSDEAHLRDLRDVATMAAIADGTDLIALEQLGVGKMDTAVVAVGEGFEASLMITAHLQKLGVPRVYTRVINEVHEHLLELLGVTGKVRVESLAAAYFSRQIANEAVHRYFGIDADHGIVELDLPVDLAGKTLSESGLRNEYGLNLITVRRSETGTDEDSALSITGTPGPEFVFREGDRLVVFGNLAKIDEFCQA